MRLFNAFVFLLAALPFAFGEEDFYKLLGIDKSAGERDIKRAYRTMSKKWHPDKNPGNEEAKQKFVDIAAAYEALSNEETRRIYDQYGHEGLKQHQKGGGHQQHHDPFDLFSRFFGGSGHFGHQQGKRRGPDMEVRMQVSLRDFYNGKEIEFEVEKQGICEECDGSGSADGVVHECESCHGRGVKIQKHMLAPGIFQQVQQVCDVCGGKGKTIAHKCNVCHGERVVRRKSKHSLTVDKGVPPGTKVGFEGEADEHPDVDPGRLIVIVDERDPSREHTDKVAAAEDRNPDEGTWFRRRGRDLVWKEVLSLREAWMGGWSRNLTHLDGHIVRLGRKKGEVVQPGHVDVIEGEGMPVWSEDQNEPHGQDFGKLLVEYTVIIPDQMSSGMTKEFWTIWEKWRVKDGVDLGKEWVDRHEL